MTSMARAFSAIKAATMATNSPKPIRIAAVALGWKL